MKLDTTKIKSTLVNFIVPLIAIVICLVLTFVVIIPALKKKPILESDLKQKQELTAQLDAKTANLKKLVDFKSVVDENSVLVANALVSEAMVPQLLTQIDKIAKESGLTVSRLSYSLSDSSNATNATVTKPSYSSITVSLGVSGSYDQLALFFANLENAARLVDVDSFRYTLASSEDTSSLDISIIVASPYLAVESSAVTDDPINLNMSSKDFVTTINEIKKLKVYQVTLEETAKFTQEQPAAETTPSTR